ncbi:facilitated trehalose transporter Tret1-2 homolog [Diprion similis]|uniref:facilitated trehalose transporter Tret1-2 homolog n=1 Tax=Diprion similis TaxID=362088 RepID=UPI001EF807D0|nr:facilitated trehalose transporter Tret1-2 homolog [Diprion similis]
MNRTKISPQILAAVTSSLILVSVGFHTGWTSPSLAKLSAEDSHIEITSDQGSWIASFMSVGSIFGSIVGVPIVDRWGRKMSLLLTSAPLFIACLLIAFATNYLWLYAARFIAGFGLGIIFTAIPMYMGEIAEDRLRGGFGILITVMQNTGSLVPYAIGPWVSITTLAAAGAVIPILYVVTFVWIPESPYYYAIKNSPFRTEKSLIWLRGTSDILEEARNIEKNVSIEGNSLGTMLELFTVRSNRKAMAIVIGLLTFQQFSGQAAILAYSTIIFDEVDSGISSSISVIITGVVQLVFGVLVIFVTDKAGRKPLLCTSMALCSVFLLAEAVYFQLRTVGSDLTGVSWLPVVAMVGYLIGYAIGLGTVPMAMTTEIFPCEIKAFAITIGAIYLCVAGICVTKFYQAIMDSYGIHVAFYAFAAWSALGIIFTVLVIPETKGRSLREIQDQLRGSSKSVRL